MGFGYLAWLIITVLQLPTVVVLSKYIHICVNVLCLCMFMVAIWLFHSPSHFFLSLSLYLVFTFSVHITPSNVGVEKHFPANLSMLPNSFKTFFYTVHCLWMVCRFPVIFFSSAATRREQQKNFENCSLSFCRLCHTLTFTHCEADTHFNCSKVSVEKHIKNLYPF